MVLIFPTLIPVPPRSTSSSRADSLLASSWRMGYYLSLSLIIIVFQFLLLFLYALCYLLLLRFVVFVVVFSSLILGTIGGECDRDRNGHSVPPRGHSL